MRLCAVTALLMGACSGDRRVPQHEERHEPEVEAPTRFEAQRSQPVEPGASVSVEGASLDVPLRALLVLDLDGDGDRDALGVEVTEGEHATVAVHIAHRDEASFRARRVGELAIDEGCHVEAASLETASAEHAFATATIACPESDAAESAGWRAWWVLTMGATPRLHETLSLRGPGDVTLTLEDLDDDRHLDLRAELDLEGASGDGPIALRWFDRPSGLARESGEPAATLSALEDRAHANRWIAALCADDTTDAARFRLGRGAWGLECPATLTQRARDARALALLEAGDLRAAVAALPDAPDATLQRALIAKATMARSRMITRWSEPTVASTRHVMLAFAGDDLIVRGVEAQLYRAARLSSAAGADPALGANPLPPLPPVPADAHSAPVTDPRDSFFVQSVHRDCNGVELRLLARAQLGASEFAAPRPVRAHSAPLEDCTQREEWRALGWAPQGVVIASLESRRTVPLTVDALALGDSVELPDDALPPAPLQGGRITPDGSVWIWETRHGVLRMDETTELWRTADWTNAPVHAAAISEDGSAIAILQNDAVRVLTREAQ